MQYSNSLIGLDSLQFAFNKAVGELSALLWFPEIQNLDEYLTDIETAAANVLDIAALIDPSKIIMKIKYHLLVHLREDIVRFGPLVGVATETFECFNAIFRFCSILSNHMAPSRDIAIQLAQQEVVRHLLSGGSWLAKNGQTWETVSPLIAKFFQENKFIRAVVGYGNGDMDEMETTSASAGGIIKLEALKVVGKQQLPRQEYSISETQLSQAVNLPSSLCQSTKQWHQGKKVTASMTLDQCSIGSWVFATSPFITNLPSHQSGISQGTNITPSSPFPICGRILDIFQRSDQPEGLVLLDVFQVCMTRDDTFGTPVLERRLDEVTLVVIQPNAILFEFNAQHDCRRAKCIASGTREVVRERKKTALTEAIIEYQPLQRYLINTYAFHNAHLLRRVLPRDLTAPISYSNNRREDHFRYAKDLRTSRAKPEAAAPAKKKKPTALESKGAKKGSDSITNATGGLKRKRAEAQLTSDESDN
ncbi:hypothetical protein BJ165DRAFT_1534006 [Panaeolus papilionaceus]|nr:hypothetical protein BJ165DRAFT_1534006 [Panaeolus papilionaceus]